MFRKLAIAVITAWAALLETAADAIAGTLPPLAADSPRLRVVAPGPLCSRLVTASPACGQAVPGGPPPPDTDQPAGLMPDDRGNATPTSRGSHHDGSHRCAAQRR